MAYDQPVSGVVKANGSVIIELPNNAAAQVWEVRQVACYTNQITNSGTVGLWKNGILQAPSAVLTPIVNPMGVQASGSSAAGLPYITLNQGDKLQAIFGGCVPGDIVVANFIIEIYLGQSYIPSPFG